MDKKKLVALLPMKANSERVRGKNFKNFAGKPLYLWMLEKLLSMPAIDLVVINTDAASILQENNLPQHPKLVVRQRPAEICGDFVSMNKIIEDDLENISAENYLMTHTTNPLLSATTMERGIKMYLQKKAEGSADSLFSVNHFQARFYRKDATPINHDPNELKRTQDLEPWYEENSNFYLFSRESFAQSHSRIGKRPILFPTARIESVDIDDQETWELAEAIAKGSQSK